jgi:hypothetical protein
MVNTNENKHPVPISNENSKTCVYIQNAGQYTLNKVILLLRMELVYIGGVAIK